MDCMLISKPTKKHETCNIKLCIEDAATTVKKYLIYTAYNYASIPINVKF